MLTTLNKIRSHRPYTDERETLLERLGKTKADDEPISIITILDIAGLDDALWCLRSVNGYKREKRLLAVRIARQVQHLMKDQRSIDALEVAERFANGEATESDLTTACRFALIAASLAADKYDSSADEYAVYAADAAEAAAYPNAEDAVYVAALAVADAVALHAAAISEQQAQILREWYAEIEAREAKS